MSSTCWIPVITCLSYHCVNFLKFYQRKLTDSIKPKPDHLDKSQCGVTAFGKKIRKKVLFVWLSTWKSWGNIWTMTLSHFPSSVSSCLDNLDLFGQVELSKAHVLFLLCVDGIMKRPAIASISSNIQQYSRANRYLRPPCSRRRLSSGI